jgi:ABC-type uncharacterized transport system fused permease/ATPase subunit
MEWASLHMTVLIQLTQMPVYVSWYGFKTIKEMGFVAGAICLGFAILSIVSCRILMTPIIRLTYQFEANNASYRLSNVRIKENAEGIALNNGESHEYSLLEAGIAKALEIQRRLANYTIGLNVVSNTFNYFGNGLVYVCIYFATPENLSDSELAEYVGRVSLLIINFLLGLLMVMNVVQNFARLSGYSTRIEELWRVLETHVAFQSTCVNDDYEILLRGVTIARPTGEILVNRLSFRIGSGESILISGPSGSGKSSILRVLGRIWQNLEGTIKCPRLDSPNSVLVLTQTPYIPVGSLYEAIAFPKLVNEVSAQKVLQAIRFVELLHLLNRPDVIWRDGLSSGEKQRVALARILVHEPRFALLDEATNAIPVRMERRIYQRFQELGIAAVTIAHRISLQEFHRYHLKLVGDGSYHFIDRD